MHNEFHFSEESLKDDEVDFEFDFDNYQGVLKALDSFKRDDDLEELADYKEENDLIEEELENLN